MTEFFADTFAILAVLAGDDAYVQRFRRGPFRTGSLNVAEAAFAQLVNEVSLEEARSNLAPFDAVAQAPSARILFEGARHQAEMARRQRHWSFVDAVGYVQARELALPFLTGDTVFEGAEGVEFLKDRGPSRHR